MRNIKITICNILLFIGLIQYVKSSLLDNKLSDGINKQQKHYTTLQAKLLYLSKSLNSYQNVNLPLQRVFSISTSLQAIKQQNNKQNNNQNNKYPNSNIQLTNSVIHFSPTTVKLSPQKYSTFIQFNLNKSKSTTKFGKQILQPNNNINQSILNDLRTPFPLQVTQILVLNQSFIFLFVFPNTVIILEEHQNIISVKNTYQIQQFINKFSSQSKLDPIGLNYVTPQTISFYPLGQSYVIGYLQQSNDLFVFDAKSYTWLKNQAQINNLEHIHAYNQKELQFFTAQRQSGFKHCKINLNNKKITLIKKYQTLQQISLSLQKKSINNKKDLQIYDISFNNQTKQIYLLDINLGVIKFYYNLTQNQNKTFKKQHDNQQNKKPTELIIKQRGCQALDYIHNDRFVLICQDRKRRFFVQAYYNITSKQYQKQPPVFHNCNFQDLQITSQFYIAFQRSSIDIFWPSKNNFIPQLVHNKKHINLLVMQAFKIKTYRNNQVYLYSVRNNVLIKQKLQEEKYSLAVGSDTPVRKQFALQVFGSCSALYLNLNDKNNKYSINFDRQVLNQFNQKMSHHHIIKDNQQNKLCKIRIPIQLQTSKYIFENRGKFSLAIGIWVICILVAFTLTCICTKKYTGMQKTAQQTLIKLKAGQKINPQFVL